MISIIRPTHAACTAIAYAAMSAQAVAEPIAQTEEIRQIIELEETVALVLTREGFAAYSALFHPDYTNWPGGSSVMPRDEFLTAVKSWHEAGNHAVSTRIHMVSVEIFGEFALSRYRLREDFNNGTAFIGRFVSLARKHDGAWRLYRTSFTTDYRGPAEEAPPGEP